MVTQSDNTGTDTCSNIDYECENTNDIAFSDSVSMSVISDFDNSDSDSACTVSNSGLMYLPLHIGSTKVLALLDSGSTINIMSNPLYSAIPQKYKTVLAPTDFPDNKVAVANNQHVAMLGMSFIKVKVHGTRQTLKVHVLFNCSNPFILGTEYLQAKGIALDFSKNSKQSYTVHCSSSITIPANTEITTFCKKPKSILIGTQGLTVTSRQTAKLGLLDIRALVTVSTDHTIPVRILNCNTVTIHLVRGHVLIKLVMLDDTFDI